MFHANGAAAKSNHNNAKDSNKDNRENANKPADDLEVAMHVVDVQVGEKSEFLSFRDRTFPLTPFVFCSETESAEKQRRS